MAAQAVAKTVERFYAATRSMNLDAWITTWDEDAVCEEPVGTAPIQGHEELSDFFLGLADLFHRVGVTEDSVFVCGDSAAVKWTGYGVGKNGREVTFEGIDVFRMNEAGKIVRMQAYWDPARMRAQLQG